MVVARLHWEVSRHALATVRGISGLEVAYVERSCELWLRGEVNEGADWQRFRALPHDGVFEVCLTGLRGGP